MRQEVARWQIADQTDQARKLIANFQSIDWDARAVMVKPASLATDVEWKVRVRTEFELVALGRPIVPFLIGSLQDENRHVRALAAYVLGVLGDGRAAVPLGQVLHSDKDATVRVYAADALGRLAMNDTAPQLDQAKNDPPFTVVADPTCWTSAVYGVAKQLMVHAEWVNAPSVFIIDKQGIVRWSHIGKGFNDRPGADVIIGELDKLSK